MDAVWTDLRSARGKRTATYLMRNMFGGFRSLREANWAISASEASLGNPWKDGGCHWRKPQDLAVITKNGALKVNWNPHLYETYPSVTHYAVQWRTADQEYSTSQQALVSETSALSHTIEGLTDGVEHFFRVVAVNDGSPDTHVDGDGHNRAVEGSAVPGRPGAPTAFTATGQDHQILLQWDDPVDSEIELSGYRAEWKSGRETFDTSRSLEVSGASTRSTVIPGLKNRVYYTVRVSAVALDGTVGESARKTVKPAGPPETPSSVTAVGGKESLLGVLGTSRGGHRA